MQIRVNIQEVYQATIACEFLIRHNYAQSLK